MEVEKRSSRRGFLQLFDWNAKSRKKLFSKYASTSVNSLGDSTSNLSMASIKSGEHDKKSQFHTPKDKSDIQAMELWQLAEDVGALPIWVFSIGISISGLEVDPKFIYPYIQQLIGCFTMQSGEPTRR